MDKENISTDVSTDIQPIKADTQPQKQFTLEDIEVYKPIQDNINYHWEWVFKIGGLVYGAVASKKDNKVRITYNIDPANLHPDYFVLISETIVPKKVYELLKQKVYSDIARLDNMMYNLVQNKSVLSMFTKFIGKNMQLGTDDLLELEEYTQADAEADKKLEQSKMVNQRTMIRSPHAQKKALRKIRENSKKNNQKKK